jgi:hypothetical protein
VASGYTSSATIISVPGNRSDVSITLMPNPTQHAITITTLNKAIASIEVISIYGQVVYQSVFNQTQAETTATIDLSNYASGIYFIRINGNDFSVLEKVIKE